MIQNLKNVYNLKLKCTYVFIIPIVFDNKCLLQIVSNDINVK